MAIISWGKPTLEIAPLGAGGVPGAFVALPTPVQDSTQLSTEAGNKLEAFVEGGERIDIRYDKNKFKCEFELYKKTA